MRTTDTKPGVNRLVGNDLITIACEEEHAFVYIPPRLNREYLEKVLSDSCGRSLAITECDTTNLCASTWGGVSHSGATVLRLSMKLGTGDHLDIVAKILCPDSVNLFKLDRQFSLRVAEVAWADWWGKQGVPWVPKVYDTRSDRTAREFWILQEYFPRVGWPDAAKQDVKFFGSDHARLLLSHAADVHAHSRKKIDDLVGLFPNDWPSLSSLVADVREVLEDTTFLSTIGVTEEERKVISGCCRAVERRPEWVDEWELVCVTADIAPDNVGVRQSGRGEELVTFDWSSTGLAPMEAEIFVLFGRLTDATREARAELARYYLDEYAERTGRLVPHDSFMARLAWANFVLHLGRIAGCARQLRWVPFVTGPRDYIHLCVSLCERLLPELAVAPA